MDQVSDFFLNIRVLSVGRFVLECPSTYFTDGSTEEGFGVGGGGIS